MATAFSNDGASIISEVISVDSAAHKSRSCSHEEFYEIEKSIKWINDNQFKKVALQFPDALLRDSARVVEELRRKTEADVVILADTSYGSCCVDEVAGEHYAADAIIHYGSSCLSPTSRYPVFFVFGRQPIDVDHCCEEATELLSTSDRVLLLYDVAYNHAIDDLASKLKRSFSDLVVSSLDVPGQDTSHPSDSSASSMHTITKCGRRIALPNDSTEASYNILFIGSNDSLFFTNCVYTFNKSKFFTYNPITKEFKQESLNVNRMLMKRYYMIEKAKDAGIVGILVGTLGVTDYITSINRLRTLLANAGKKSYTFVVGKINVAKLANFAEIEAYVLVACPENSLLDSSDFYQPIVTPYEMEIACNPQREWTGDYVVDFRELLPGGSSYVEVSSEPQSLTTDVSLISGGLRRLGVDEDDRDTDSGSLVKRDDHMTVANTAGEFLSGRSWQGLEQQLGKTPVVKAVEGSTGIAMTYSHEPTS